MDDSVQHRFEPVEDVGVERDSVRARCLCGWEGSTPAAAEGGYADARAEWEAHIDSFDEDLAPLDEAPEPPT